MLPHTHSTPLYTDPYSLSHFYFIRPPLSPSSNRCARGVTRGGFSLFFLFIFLFYILSHSILFLKRECEIGGFDRQLLYWIFLMLTHLLETSRFPSGRIKVIHRSLDVFISFLFFFYVRFFAMVYSFILLYSSLLAW